MYSRDGALHFSTLKYIKQSPMHYVNAVARTDFDTPSMRIGRAVHGLILLEEKPCVFDGTRRGQPWKDFCEEYRLETISMEDQDERNARNIGDVLNAAEWDKVQRMRDAVFADPFAKAVLDTCTVREEALEWTRSGHPCKGRLDARSPSRSAICDLKTAKSVQPWQFMRDGIRQSYHAQLPWYDNAQGKSIGNWSDQFVVAVESVAPFPVQVFHLSPLCILQGWDETCLWMEKLDECIQRGNFRAGYKAGIVEWDAELVFGEDEDEEDEECQD